MQLKRIFLAILAVVILVGGPMAPRCQAAVFLDFTDNSGTGVWGYLSDSIVWYGSWTQTTASANTSIGAIVTWNRNVHPGHAWLTNQVGPGTANANVLASAEFTAPSISNRGDLTNAPYTSLFTGLSLSPGTYFLVLQGPASSSSIIPYAWLGDFLDIGVNTAPGFTLGAYGVTSTPDSFIPASEFGNADPDDKFFFRVESSAAVPLPGAVLLLGAGLLRLAAYRRRQES